MRRGVRRTLAVTAVALAAAAVALWAWLPFDPLEPSAGPLDRMLPAGVDSAWRFDGPALLGSAFANAAWEREEVRDLRARLDVEGRFLAPLRRLEDVVAEATFGLADAPGAERDLCPAEVVVATRGDGVLALSRISTRARFLELVRRFPAERARSLGLRADGPYLALEPGDGPTVWLARKSDVLLASTSRALLADALDAAAGRRGATVPAEIRDALALGRPAGPRVLGWVRPDSAAARLLGGPPPDRAEDRSWWADLLVAPDAEALRVEIDLSRGDRVAATVRLAWRDGLPPSLAPLRGHDAPDAPSLAPRVERYALAHEAIVVGGLSVHASAVLRALLASQPPERQSLLEDALASTGESIDTLSASLAERLEDGVGFAVARLREADRVLGGDDAGAVHGIPATLVVFRLRGAGAAEALLGELRGRSETLFGAPLGDVAETLGDGTRLHTLRPRGLTGEWALLRPAFAFRGDEFVFSTHEGYLRRALAGATRSAISVPAEDAATLTLGVAAGPLHRWVDDQAWEVADRSTWRDWAAERARLDDEIPPDSPLRAADRERYLDERVRALRRTRREVEIPQAADDFRAGWEWLARLSAVEASVDLDGNRASIRLAVAPARE